MIACGCGSSRSRRSAVDIGWIAGPLFSNNFLSGPNRSCACHLDWNPNFRFPGHHLEPAPIPSCPSPASNPAATCSITIRTSSIPSTIIAGQDSPSFMHSPIRVPHHNEPTSRSEHPHLSCTTHPSQQSVLFINSSLHFLIPVVLLTCDIVTILVTTMNFCVNSYSCNCNETHDDVPSKSLNSIG